MAYKEKEKSDIAVVKHTSTQGLARRPPRASVLLCSSRHRGRRALPPEGQHGNHLPASCAAPTDAARPGPKGSLEVLGSGLSRLITAHPCSQAGAVLTPGAGGAVIFPPNP